jgi:hypothetical protein
MRNKYDDLTAVLAISYVCTETQDYQKYESFLVMMDAKSKNVKIISEYRDFEGHGLSSNRQGFLQMVKDIENQAVPPLIMVRNATCLPKDMKALGIDDAAFEQKVTVVELERLGRGMNF